MSYTNELAMCGQLAIILASQFICVSYSSYRDTAGAARFQSITAAYYQGADVSKCSDQKITVVFSSMQGIMLVFDVTNEQSFDNIKHWLKTVDTVISYVQLRTQLNVMYLYLLLHAPKHCIRVTCCICSLLAVIHILVTIIALMLWPRLDSQLTTCGEYVHGGSYSSCVCYFSLYSIRHLISMQINCQWVTNVTLSLSVLSPMRQHRRSVKHHVI